MPVLHVVGCDKRGEGGCNLMQLANPKGGVIHLSRGSGACAACEWGAVEGVQHLVSLPSKKK